MSRPKVELPNYKAVYDYYEDHRQNQLFARFAHKAAARLFKPHFTFEDGAEEAIDTILRNKGRLFIADNHLTGNDQFLALAMAETNEVFHPLRGNTDIPTEPSLQSRPWVNLKKRKFLAGPVLRRAVDEAGAKPIVRTLDLERAGIPITPELEEMQKEAVIAFDDMEYRRVAFRGLNLFGYWEGTRNRINHREVQTLKKGMAYTACRVAQVAPAFMLTTGHYYGGEPNDYMKEDVPMPREPDFHISMPFEIKRDTTPSRLVEIVHPIMQDCVDITVLASEARAD